MTPTTIQFMQDSFNQVCRRNQEGALWRLITIDEHDGITLGTPSTLADLLHGQFGRAMAGRVVRLGTTCSGVQSEAIVLEPIAG